MEISGDGVETNLTASANYLPAVEFQAAMISRDRQSRCSIRFLIFDEEGFTQ
jgi:hypothetical protein